MSRALADEVERVAAVCAAAIERRRDDGELIVVDYESPFTPRQIVDVALALLDQYDVAPWWLARGVAA